MEKIELTLGGLKQSFSKKYPKLQLPNILRKENKLIK
jgi:hypothetical protein